MLCKRLKNIAVQCMRSCQTGLLCHGNTTHVLPVYIHRSVQAENNANYCIYGGGGRVSNCMK